MLAALVSALPVRLLLGALGAFVSWFFGPNAIALALVGAAELDPFALFLGFGGVLGLVGWWLRVLVPPGILGGSTWLRRVVLTLLVLGTASVSYLAVDLGGPWRWISIPAAVAGVVMVLGTLRGPGPNNSFKPKPLRGSA